jgi:hypothetical protein
MTKSDDGMVISSNETRKKLGPRGWQRSKIDCKHLGPEFRQPLVILQIFRGKNGFMQKS